MGRADLIGNSKKHLIPLFQPAGTGKRPEGARILRDVPVKGEPRVAPPTRGPSGFNHAGPTRPTSALEA